MRSVLAAICLAATLLAPGARAQTTAEFPNRPIRLVIPYGPGGATDIAGRILAEALGPILGKPVVVENRPGGNGVIALQQVARAQPDGHALLVGNVTTNVINPIIEGAAMPLDVERDLAPVGRLIEVPAIFVATRVNFPPSSVAEVVEYARARPGVLNFTSAGVLSYSHLDFVQLQGRTGTRLTLIPSRAGAGTSQNDLITGEVHVALLNAATVLPLVQGGQIRAFAVTARERLPALPDVPTMAEAGFPDIGTNAWQALSAPAGTPDAIMARLHAAVGEAMAAPAAREQFARLQFATVPSASPREARGWVRAEFARWEPIVRDGQKLGAP